MSSKAKCEANHSFFMKRFIEFSHKEGLCCTKNFHSASVSPVILISFQLTWFLGHHFPLCFLMFVFLKLQSSHRDSNGCVAWATSNLNQIKHFNISWAVNIIFSPRSWQQKPLWYIFSKRKCLFSFSWKLFIIDKNYSWCSISRLHSTIYLCLCWTPNLLSHCLFTGIILLRVLSNKRAMCPLVCKKPHAILSQYLDLMSLFCCSWLSRQTVVDAPFSSDRKLVPASYWLLLSCEV